MNDFALYLQKRHGLAVIFALHAPDQHGSQKNYHAHLLLSSRRVVDGIRLGEKARELDVRQTGRIHLEDWRKEWARLVNEALANAGIAERIDHRSLARRGILRTPKRHLGPAASAMERRGKRTFLGDLNREIGKIAQQMRIGVYAPAPIRHASRGVANFVQRAVEGKI
ncbi:MAG: MobA/MobL family protein [Alphaproteobacteria bacterium]|nr:MobA/MobL family protein [Alphaproteobacteria bacterium]